MAETTATKKAGSKKPAKKTSAKKTPAKKSSATTSSARKATSEKAPPAKKTARRSRAPAKASAEAPPQRTSGARMAGVAREVVQSMTGKTPESVTGIERADEGWRVAVEVLELERIPSTTDVMATYQVTLDDRGELQGYQRVHRYVRGKPGDE